MVESGNIFIDYVVNVMKFGHVNHDSKQVITDDKLFQGGIVSRRFLAPHEKLMAWRPLFTTFWLPGVLLARQRDRRESRTHRGHRAGFDFGHLHSFGASLQTWAQNGNWMICSKEFLNRHRQLSH